MSKKAVIIIPILLVDLIGIAIVTAHLLVTLQIPPENFHLRCLQHNLESIPHMKWNCYYFNH
ncbi:MAG: hypothetical protein KGI09_06935 [Thaumarchaeota archaeon]|nr:hypothetical protein [Nitrososphaerota archaeon]